MGDAYRDLFNVDIEEVTKDLVKNKRRGPRGGVVDPFPVRLYDMLETTQKSGLSDVVSWQEHGRCFILHQPARFVSEILPRFFRQTKLTSFQRQLSLYSFQRIICGKDRGGYYHEMFLRGRPDIARVIVRTPVKGQSNTHSTVGEGPDFYALPFCGEGKSEAKSATAEAPECSADTQRIEARTAKKRRASAELSTPSFAANTTQAIAGGAVFGLIPQPGVASLVGGFPGALVSPSFPQNLSSFSYPLISLQLLAASANHAIQPVLPLGQVTSVGSLAGQPKGRKKLSNYRKFRFAYAVKNSMRV